MSIDEIKENFKKEKISSYRALQIYKWLHEVGVTSFAQMTNIPKELRDILNQRYNIYLADIENKLTSSYNNTVKYLFRLNDGEFIESVVMKYKHGYSMCVSTQVGCKMGCKFCATGKNGFTRNLLASEIISQIHSAQKDLNVRISNVVLMGMGEPLDNYDNVIKFLRLVSSEHGLNIGMRHISLSTCGIVDKIYDLAEEKFPLTLSVSLHAPNDSIRNKIMPINKKFNIKKLLKACDFYLDKTKRRISFEYTMINNLNDTDECANELSSILKNKLCHVNLIPVNNVKNSSFKKSDYNKLLHFQKKLINNGINTTIRRTLGSDINASCGQLRQNICKKKEVSRFEDI